LTTKYTAIIRIIIAALAVSTLVAGLNLASLQQHQGYATSQTKKQEQNTIQNLHGNFAKRSVSQHIDQEKLCLRAGKCSNSNVGEQTQGNDNSVTGFSDQSKNAQTTVTPTPSKGTEGTPNSNTLAGVFPPTSHPFGLTYGQWSTKWWQWIVSIPSSNSPITDTTGQNCAVGQQGIVWFLAGTTGNPINNPVMRTCTIPSGQAILFPIINGECSTAEGNGNTEADLRACASSQMDAVTTLQASVDGVVLTDLQTFRAQSPLYQFTAIDGNPFGIPAGTTDSVADGFWIMLHPLSPGVHTISFAGALNLPSGGSFSTSVQYKLIVVP
jgi:hypothetical protein